NIFRKLKDNSLLSIAEYKKNMAASILIIYSEGFAHYYLGGSDEKFLKFYPNNLLFYESILHLKDAGQKIFDLGGGYRSKDSLYLFKKSFSKTTLDFFTYSKVHMPNEYKKICNAKLRYNERMGVKITNTDYFPMYRAV
ncbi:MAG: GNAT family N-acetyltransferase, partial [Candidatus Aenigmatarchaeota archaeon]